MSPTCVHPSPVPSSQNFQVPITLKQAHAACRALISSCQYLQIDENEDYKGILMSSDKLFTSTTQLCSMSLIFKNQQMCVSFEH